MVSNGQSRIQLRMLRSISYDLCSKLYTKKHFWLQMIYMLLIVIVLVHMLNYYKDTMGAKDDDYPGARDANNQSMAIPLHNRMTEEDYKYVVDCLKAV